MVAGLRGRGLRWVLLHSVLLRKRRRGNLRRRRNSVHLVVRCGADSLAIGSEVLDLASGRCHVGPFIESGAKSPTFTSIVQIVACEIGSSPSSPRSAYGLSRATPIGPLSTKLWVIQPERAREGSRRV